VTDLALALRSRVTAHSFASTLLYPLALASVAAISFVAYALADAPIFNPAISVDPWLYTAAFDNLGYVYQHFGSTYYVSRLPWIIPGHIAYSIFPPPWGYYVLNFSYFLGGAVLLALLVRRYAGDAASVVAFALLVSSPIYWNAHYWDYVDGPELTYLFASMYFLLLRPQRRRLRLVCTAIGGFFAAAAVTTQLYAALFVAAFGLVVAIVEFRRPIKLGRGLVESIAAFVAGAVVLDVVCGSFSKAHGGEALFFMPQVRYLRVADPASYRNPHYDWSNQPRILVPLFLLLVLAAVVRRRPETRAMLRVAVGLGLFLLITYAVLAAWEFLDSGTPFELPDRFVQLEAPMAPVVGVIVGYLLSRLVPRARYAVVVAGVLASIAPLLVVYGWGGARATVGGTGLRVGIALMGAAVVAAVLARFARRLVPALTLAAVVLLCFGANWSLAASHETETWFHGPGQKPAVQNRSTYNLGLKLIDFLRTNGYQSRAAFFWYDLGAASYLEGIQSLYYFSYSYVGISMPKIDADFRFRMKLYMPKELVLLCTDPRCGGAQSTLRAAGLRFSPVATQFLSSGRERMWVRVLRTSS
jgi:hypothetical protein